MRKSLAVFLLLALLVCSLPTLTFASGNPNAAAVSSQAGKGNWKAGLTPEQLAALRGRAVKDRLKVNGNLLKYDIPPVIKEGRTLIPVRAITNGLGAAVTWDAATKTITITRGDVKVVLVLGQMKMYVNGVEKVMDVPAQLISNRTFVPLRFIAMALGDKVDYDEDTGDIDIHGPLATPAQPTLMNGIAAWTAVANENDGYTVRLFRGDAIVATVSVDHGAALTYNFATQMIADGIYTVKVKALATGDYTDSAYSAASLPQVVGEVSNQLATPAKPTLTNGIATWTAVANENSGYTLQLYRDNTVVATVTVAHGATLAYNFSAQMVAAGSYTVKVKALGTGAYINSAYSVASIAQVVAPASGQLATPAQPTLANGIATWTAVANENDGYSIKLYRDSDIVTTVSVDHGAPLTYDFSARMTAAGSYTVKVRALGTGNYTDSDYSPLSTPQVVAPASVQLATPAQPTLVNGVAAWTAVANENNGYSLKLYRGDTVVATVVITHGAALAYDFSAQMAVVGSYTIKVKALGTGAYLDSDYSPASAAQIVAPAAPTAPVVNDTADTFGWTWVSGYSDHADYEYSIDGGAIWQVCTANPQPVGNHTYAAGAVRVRVKADLSTGRPVGAVLISNAAFTTTSTVTGTIAALIAPTSETLRITIAYTVNGNPASMTYDCLSSTVITINAQTGDYYDLAIGDAVVATFVDNVMTKVEATR